MRSVLNVTALAALLVLPAAALTTSGDTKPAPQKGGDHPGGKPAPKPGEKGGGDKGAGEKGKPPAPKPPPAAPTHAAIGSEVDRSLALTDVHGKPVKLDTYRGKVTVIEFWSADPAGAALDKKTAKLVDDYSKKGVAFVLVDAAKADCDGAEATLKRVSDQATKSGLECTIACDPKGAWADVLGAAAAGDVFVIDAKGMLAYRGALDDDPKGDKADKATPYLANALDSVIAGKAATPNTTPSNGMPIHRDAKPTEASGKK